MTTATRVDRELLFEFFLTFARFENALKTTGYVVKPRVEGGKKDKHPCKKDKKDKFPRNAEPNWDSFAVSLRPVFDPKSTTELADACDYILNNSPSRQVIMDEAGTL